MAEIDLGAHFDDFIRRQVGDGRFRDAAEGVRAGLALLEACETDGAARRAALIREIGQAFDDPGPAIPANAMFERLERRHAAEWCDA